MARMTVQGEVSRFLKACEGVTAVEFAFVAPLFIFFTFVAIELGLYQIETAGLSYATQEAARSVLVGDVANSLTATSSSISAAAFAAKFVCPHLPPPMDCANVRVRVTYAANTAITPSGLAVWATPDLAAFTTRYITLFACPGQGGGMLRMWVAYMDPPMILKWMNPDAATNGMTYITSTAAFKNEYFAAPNNSGLC